MSLPITSVLPTFMNPVTRNESGTSYTQRFQVLFNNDNATNQELQLIEAKALTAPGIPRYGSVFRGDRAAYCNSITPVVAGDNANNLPFKVIVTCLFTTVSSGKKDEDKSPLRKSPDIMWATESVNEVLENARILQVQQGNKTIETVRKRGVGNILQQINNFAVGITNSCGQPFSTSPQRAVPYPTVTIVQNLPFFDPKLMINTVGTINVRSFKIDGETIKSGQALLVQRDATTAYQGKLTYRIVTTKLLIKQTHDITILDNGHMIFAVEGEKFAAGDPLDRIPIEFNGVVLTELVKLDGKGNVLGKDADDVYLKYGIYNAQDFRRLKLPSRRQ